MPRNKLSPLEIEIRKTISDNLKFYSRGMTQKELSEKTGIPVSTLSGYFAKRSTPNIGTIEKLSEALNVNKSDIDPRLVKGSMPNNVIPITKITKIPLLGTIACGDPILAEENIEEYISEPADDLPSGKLFYLKAKGNSMKPTIPNGSKVLIRLQEDVEDSEIAAVLMTEDNEATLKRIKRVNGTMFLMPDNPEFDPIIADKNHPARILGKAIRYTSDL
ncbi:LexA family protein [Liquorilactobacillus capillatus]|nr:XRE family transcriptional regulator [Liquorilactobacillus capillatus]